MSKQNFCFSLTAQIVTAFASAKPSWSLRWRWSVNCGDFPTMGMRFFRLDLHRRHFTVTTMVDRICTDKSHQWQGAGSSIIANFYKERIVVHRQTHERKLEGSGPDDPQWLYGTSQPAAEVTSLYSNSQQKILIIVSKLIVGNSVFLPYLKVCNADDFISLLEGYYIAPARKLSPSLRVLRPCQVSDQTCYSMDATLSLRDFRVIVWFVFSTILTISANSHITINQWVGAFAGKSGRGFMYDLSFVSNV